MFKVGSPEADAATLRALQDAGSDLSKPTNVRFYLYLPTEELARRAATQGAISPLKVTVDHAASGDTWLCLIEGTMVPSAETIAREGKRLGDLAVSLGGEYDGWEAAVKK